MKRRAVLHSLTPEITCIDDAGESVCYVVCGKERAAVIDTVNGKENLRLQKCQQQQTSCVPIYYEKNG